MKPYPILGLLALFALVVSSSCGGGGGGSASLGFHAEVWASGLSFPTAMCAAPFGEIFVTEKSTGNVRRITAGSLDPNPIFNVAVHSGGERGLLGIAVAGSYHMTGYVYLFYTKPNGTENTVVRFTNGPSGPDTTVIVPSLPANNTHNGGRLAFGSDNKLYVTLGDVGDPANSQSDTSPAGKVLRFNEDGSIPDDNPIPGNPLYSRGHRNCFGIAVTNARLFVSENGPDCDDEVNSLVPGGNFGWRPGQPCNDNDPSYLPPLVRFSSVIAPTGMAVYFNSLLVGGSNDGRLRQIRLNDFPNGSLDSVSTVYTTTGGEPIIDVIIGDDGSPYIATTDFSSGRILKLVPN